MCIRDRFPFVRGDMFWYGNRFGTDYRKKKNDHLIYQAVQWRVTYTHLVSILFPKNTLTVCIRRMSEDITSTISSVSSASSLVRTVVTIVNNYSHWAAFTFIWQLLQSYSRLENISGLYCLYLSFSPYFFIFLYNVEAVSYTHLEAARVFMTFPK